MLPIMLLTSEQRPGARVRNSSFADKLQDEASSLVGRSVNI